MSYKECIYCEYFEEHPFAREGDFEDYCDKYNMTIKQALDIVVSACLCEYYNEIEN